MAAVLLAWLVISRSFGAYLAIQAPSTALHLLPSDARALLNLVDAEFAKIQAVEGVAPSAQRAAKPGNGKVETTEQASDSLRLWAELGLNRLKQESKRPPDANEELKASSPKLDRETIELMAGWTQVALLNDPLNARAVSVLGQLADAVGDEAGAEKLFRVAAQRSLRERVATYWLMQKSYETRDYTNAVYHADTLLRTRSQAARYVMPMLVQIGENKDGMDALKVALLNNPRWRSSFLATFAQTATDPRATLEMLLAIRATAAPPSTEDLRNYMNALIARKQHELAYYAWLEFLAPEQLSSTGFLFNGSFEQAPSGLPFDWVLGEGAGVTIDITERPQRDGERALYIEFGHGRVEFPRVEQLIMLAPGAYEFKGSYKAELQGKRGLVWRVACTNALNKPIGESLMAIGPVPKWKDIAFSFTIPATDCRTQQVRLELDARMASEQLLSGYIWYDELRILRAGTDHRP